MENRRGGRPRRDPEAGERVPMSFRVTPDFYRRVSAVARKTGRSIAQQIEFLLEAGLREDAQAPYPPEIAALVELIGRTMVETGTAISGGNRLSGHGAKSWLDDPYAFDQALDAASHFIELCRPEGNTEPHGLFATPDYPAALASTIGRQVAAGVLAVMRGVHEAEGTATATASQWAPSVRARLGRIGERLDQHPIADDYFVSKTEPGRLHFGEDGQITVEAVPDEDQPEREARRRGEPEE